MLKPGKLSSAGREYAKELKGSGVSWSKAMLIRELVPVTTWKSHQCCISRLQTQVMNDSLGCPRFQNAGSEITKVTFSSPLFNQNKLEFKFESGQVFRALIL